MCSLTFFPNRKLPIGGRDLSTSARDFALMTLLRLLFAVLSIIILFVAVLVYKPLSRPHLSEV
jgi:hypothetical protein